ncbi:hypothetical protein LQF61_12740, partial [Tetragenococcus koreensis]|uniref:hypothetical protein n=1 Tax=Tetragenococcus koreensis TaxID=290335 RepID=UPI001F21BBC9
FFLGKGASVCFLLDNGNDRKKKVPFIVKISLSFESFFYCPIDGPHTSFFVTQFLIIEQRNAYLLLNSLGGRLFSLWR